jgi:class 3 adenylate cyclase
LSVDLFADEQSALNSAWRLQRTGNFVAALDLSQDSLRRWPTSQALQHLWILALASCGSTQTALDALRASSLGLNLDEDCLALEARLLKDLAFSGVPMTATRLTEAAAAYERVAQRTGGTYTRQNAALLWMLAGDPERAFTLARAVVRQLATSDVPKDEEAAYFHWATLAEAALVLGDQAQLERALAGANPLCRRNSWARSRTLLQMRRLAGMRPECAALIERWYRPSVGLVLNADWVPARLGDAVGIEAGDTPALAYCYGREPGQDWHELAALGVQLHAIYPDTHFPPKPLAANLPPERDASGRVDTHTWSSLFLDKTDDQQLYCAQTALGLSIGQASEMQAPWVILAKSAGRWFMYQDADRTALSPALGSIGNPPEERSKYAFLFADAVSYSSLNADETRAYWTSLLPQTAAAVLKGHSRDIVVRKTWGDSVHAVFRSASQAAAAALEIQDATAHLKEGFGDGRRLIFRMALHYGPADHAIDPVEETPSVFGPQLSFAARIEPVAPPGGIFVTEPFAAQLSLEGAQNVHCSYVGTTSLPKTYGRVRLLRLTR